MMGRRVANFLVACLLCVVATGCSVQRFAANKFADALSGGGGAYASDDDPELIRQATPFSLKLMESVLGETPEHRGLLLSLCSGFTQYSYAFVNEDADQIEGKDLAAANAMRDRARKLYLRGRGYGLRGFEVAYPGFSGQIRKDPKSAVKQVGKEDVPLLYWTAAAWGAAISISKNNPELIADQPIVEALIDRALELDESFEDGAIHSFLISYEGARQGASGSATERARKHFDRAVELSKGLSASPYVAYAEAVCVQLQKKAEFTTLLQKALAVDVNAHPQTRLGNLIMQQRAKWLLSRTDELFVE